MIFVNDMASLRNVPQWLGHAEVGEDFLGFSDIVFPAFLFAIGLSIPFAIENRMAKGESQLKTALHILFRSFALLVMGVFTVNTGVGISREIGLSQPVFNLLMVSAFFLIWNIYPKTKAWKQYLFTALQIAGIALLIYLAVIYRDRSGAIMQKHWWGILGLIGWTYLLCASIYLVFYKQLYVMLATLFAFILLNIAGANGLLGGFSGYIISNGTFQIFTMSGIIVSLFFSRYKSDFQINKLLTILAFAGVYMLLAGAIARNWWIVCKLSEMPPWVYLCTGISILLYVFLYWLIEIKGKENWFRIIKPAGTATLTCYLTPIIVYAVFRLCNVRFPDIIREYPLGLLKSLAFALLVIGITALMGKIRIKLKI